MSAVQLPTRPDREALLGFWIASVMVGTSLGGGVALLLGTPFHWTAGVAIAAALLLVAVGRRRERMVDRLYRRWDRAAVAYAHRARDISLIVWYTTVVAAVARLGGVKQLQRDRSEWYERTTLHARAYADPGGRVGDRQAVGGFRDYSRWALHGGRPWALVLYPVLLLMRGLDTERRHTVASDVYTLY